MLRDWHTQRNETPMHKRRDFLKAVGATAAFSIIRPRHAVPEIIGNANPETQFTSQHMEVALSSSAPEFVILNVDGLGKGRRGANIVGANNTIGGYKASVSDSRGARRVEYRPAVTPHDSPAAWTFEFSSSRIVLASNWSTESAPPPIVFPFNLKQVHSTVLGVFRQDRLLLTPALMHFPGQGSLRLTSSVPEAGLAYTSRRTWNRTHFDEAAMLSLPAASAEHQRIVYTLDVTAIYPHIRGIEGDSRFDPFRRNWLNVLQLNPSTQALANHTASDTCGFCYYEYADIAAMTPPLTEGLNACDLVRQTLDRILAGKLAYGMPGYGSYPTTSADTWPSMIIAAANCVRDGSRDAWLEQNYSGIRGWAEAMLATDTDDDGLMQYSLSGDSGTWKFDRNGNPLLRPSNWWDALGFGHEDAYANALAYRALPNMAMMAKRVGRADDARRYLAAAEKLRAAYFKCFLNPATGILGGWRSADGQLHDYYFLWVNGIAIHYGLVERPEANAIMDKLMTKMKEVGYHSFSMGLPGNLVSVALKDCANMHGPSHSEGFQIYENGGATGSFAFFTLAALYDLGRKAEADEILFPMLDAYGKCGFEGTDALGFSADWKMWDGTYKGYEGFLVDNYYPLLAVLLRQDQTRWHSDFRPPTTLT
jgi:Bacterial alpha-L-rhamnosidase 6 hairpin glycosidase domain